MRSPWFWPALNGFGLIAVITVNALANILPLNGIPTGDIVNRDPVLFQPAGWAFSIWGVIYLWLAAFVVYGLTPAGRANPRLQRISPLFLFTCAANTVWLFLWHWQRFPASLLVMFALLLGLIGIYGGLRRDGVTPSTREWLLLWLPFSVYLGWVSVATLANTSVLLDRVGWDGGGVSLEVWTALMLVAALALAAVFGLRQADFAYPAVVAWAAAAIAARQTGVELVAPSAVVVAVAAAAFALVALVRQVRAWPRLTGGGQALAT